MYDVRAHVSSLLVDLAETRRGDAEALRFSAHVQSPEPLHFFAAGHSKAGSDLSLTGPQVPSDPCAFPVALQA